MLRDLQESWRRTLLSGVSPDAHPAPRMAIYRNNVTLSLTEVLAAAFPAVERVAGTDLFGRLAADFVRQHPPEKPQLLAYGDRFPSFLSSLPGVAVPELPDLARLEWARNEAYFAADAKPLDGRELQDVPPAAYATLRFEAHPSVRLVASPYPVHDLWHAATAEDDVRAVEPSAQNVVIVRPYHAVAMHTVGPGAFALISSMCHGDTLGDASEHADSAEHGFDLQGTLALALSEGMFRGVAG